MSRAAARHDRLEPHPGYRGGPRSYAAAGCRQNRKEGIGMRNFVCRATEALCDHGGCKKDILCIIERENEARRREADATRLLAVRAEEADIASMMLAIAKKDILDAYRKKHGKGFDKGDEALAEAAKLLLR